MMLRFRSSKLPAAAGAVAALALLGLISGKLLEFAPLKMLVSARPHLGDGRGEYGGDLDFLRRHWMAGDAPGESNHYIDLWSPGSLPLFVRLNGLTNNHALFVDSHSKAGCSARGTGFGFYPRVALLEPGAKTPHYSAGDLATVMGPDLAATIHNIVLAGCNEEGRFRSAEFRRHFVNATNITYMEPGKLAFKPMFYQAILLPSAEVKPLYGNPRRVSPERIECDIVDEPRRGTRPLGTYIADLYLPGGRKPYQTRKAGRELLDPPRVTTVASRTGAATESGKP
jgi:hypothetical protein